LRKFRCLRDGDREDRGWNEGREGRGVRGRGPRGVVYGYTP